MCTDRLFLQWVDLFALKFYLDRIVTISHSYHQKTRDTGLLDGEYRIHQCSLVLTQYWSGTHRQTDRRICRSIYSTCKEHFSDQEKVTTDGSEYRKGQR